MNLILSLHAYNMFLFINTRSHHEALQANGAESHTDAFLLMLHAVSLDNTEKHIAPAQL